MYLEEQENRLNKTTFLIIKLFDNGLLYIYYLFVIIGR